MGPRVVPVLRLKLTCSQGCPGTTGRDSGGRSSLRKFCVVVVVDTYPGTPEEPEVVPVLLLPVTCSQGCPGSSGRDSGKCSNLMIQFSGLEEFQQDLFFVFVVVENGLNWTGNSGGSSLTIINGAFSDDMFNSEIRIT